MTRSFAAHRLVATALLAGILILFALMAAYAPLGYIHATYEDLLGEWTQVFLFALTLGLSVRLATTPGPYRMFFAVLALACFYVVGEEISWGQRLLDIPTPEFFRRHNLQQETNLHNLFTGPVGTWGKRLIESGVSVGLLVYGLVLPLALRVRHPLALRLDRLGLALPPLYLWPYFAAAALLEMQLFRFNEAEIAELLIPLALTLTCAWHLQHRRRGLETTAPLARKDSRALAWQSLLLASAALFLAGTTTLTLAHSSRLSALSSQRIENGMEKFALRYERYEAWDHAETLYQQLVALKPGDASLWRRLSRVQALNGRTDESARSLQAALQVDQDNLMKNPASLRTHLSLVRTCRLTGLHESAEEHLQFALERAREWTLREPSNPKAFYWLSLALELDDAPVESLACLEKAATLDPLSLTYSRELARLKAQEPLAEDHL